MITFVSHLRIDNEDRLRNLQNIINFYSQNIEDVEFIFVEDDKVHNEQLKNIKWNKNTKFLFMENNGVWYKTKALNIAVKYCENDIVTQLDIDCIFNPNSIKECALKLKNNEEYHFGYPYNGYIIDIKPEFYNQFEKNNLSYDFLINCLPNIRDLKLKYDDENITVRCTNEEHQGVGGIAMFKTDIFKKLGGYNTNFYCWGAEDNEINYRFKKLGYNEYRINDLDSIGFHLYHKNAIRHGNPYYKDNVNEYNKIKDFDRVEMIEYIKKWNMYV